MTVTEDSLLSCKILDNKEFFVPSTLKICKYKTSSLINKCQKIHTSDQPGKVFQKAKLHQTHRSLNCAPEERDTVADNVCLATYSLGTGIFPWRDTFRFLFTLVLKVKSRSFLSIQGTLATGLQLCLCYRVCHFHSFWNCVISWMLLFP